MKKRQPILKIVKADSQQSDRKADIEALAGRIYAVAVCDDSVHPPSSKVAVWAVEKAKEFYAALEMTADADANNEKFIQNGGKM